MKFKINLNYQLNKSRVRHVFSPISMKAGIKYYTKQLIMRRQQQSSPTTASKDKEDPLLPVDEPHLHQKASQPISYEFRRQISVAGGGTVGDGWRQEVGQGQAGLTIVLKAIGFKALKENLILHRNLSSLAHTLLQSQIDYHQSLATIQSQLPSLSQTLLSHGTLSQGQLYDLLDSAPDLSSTNWPVMDSISKSLAAKLTESIADKKEAHLIELIGDIVEGLQIYKVQYAKLGRVLGYLAKIDSWVLRELLCPGQKREEQTSEPMYQSERVKLRSEILEDEEIPTKHTYQFTVQQTHSQKCQQLLKLLQAVHKIRKHVLIPFEKLCQFTLLITQFINLSSRLPSSTQNLKARNNYILTLSVILHKIMSNQYSQMGVQGEAELVGWMIYKFPGVFYHRGELQKEERDSQDHMGTPFILSFGAFRMFFMGIPCDIYLVNNSLIIVKASPQPQPCYFPSAKTSPPKPHKKQQEYLKLALLSLDHTTRIEVVSCCMPSRGFVLYISGGQTSSGAYVQFRGQEASEDDLARHGQVCVVEECMVCEGGLEGWTQSLAKSNMMIMKTILQLTVAYQTFVYVNVQNSTFIYLTPHLEQEYHCALDPTLQTLTSTYTQAPSAQLIPKNRVLSFRILGIDYHCQKQNLQYLPRNYIVQLQVNAYYGDWHSVAQIVHLSECQIEDIIYFIEKCEPQLGKYVAGAYHSLLSVRTQGQLFGFSDIGEGEACQLECMIINEYFNSFFKLKQFRTKPQLIAKKLKLSQGMWQMLIQGSDINMLKLYVHDGQIYRRTDCPCECEECVLEGGDAGDVNLALGKFWKYYDRLLPFPYNQVSKAQQIVLAPEKQKQDAKGQRIQELIKVLTKQITGIKKHKKPYCPYAAHKIEDQYIRTLDKLYRKKLEQHEKLSPEQQILEYYNKIKYVKCLAQNYHIMSQENKINCLRFGLGNTVLKTHQVKSLNVLLYCLPSLGDYYHQLSDNTNLRQQQIFSKLQATTPQISLSLMENHGFLSKLVVNLYKDTTCRHLKYIIGQMLGLQEDYIMHFMESYRLVIVRKEQTNKRSIGMNFMQIFKKTVQPSRQYQLKQLYELYDHEKVWEIRQELQQSQDHQYHISIRKLLKVESPLLLPTNPTSTIIKSYYTLLELELAQIWYKINNGHIRICENTQNFLTKYITLIFAFLHAKMKDKKKNFQQKWKYKLNEQLLVKTGILTLRLFEMYYDGLDLNRGLDGTEKEEQKNNFRLKNLQYKLGKRLSLQQLCLAQIEATQNPQQILNKLIHLCYAQTNWGTKIHSILNIGQNLKKTHQNCYIFIRREGIVVDVSLDAEGSMEGAKSEEVMMSRASLKTISSGKSKIGMTKSGKTKKSKDEEKISLKFSYEDIQIQIHGSIISIMSHMDVKYGNFEKKWIFFSAHAYSIYELITFYKIHAKHTPIEKLDMTQSKLKIKFTQQKKSLENPHFLLKPSRHAEDREKSVAQQQQQQVAQEINLNDRLYRGLEEKRRTARMSEMSGFRRIHSKKDEEKK